MIKIAFTRPIFKPRYGGVTSYINMLIKNLSDQKFRVYASNFKSFGDGNPARRSNYEKWLIKINIVLYFVKFPYVLIKNKIDIVHSNPSMMFIPIIRDSFFILVAYLLKKKILILIHGWNSDHVEKIKRHYLICKTFGWILNRADLIIVLAAEFKNFLRDMGVNAKIEVESTMVDDNLFQGIKKEQIIKRNLDPKLINLLYLSRIEESKGIYRTINAFEILNQRHNNIMLHIAGDGSELSSAKKYVQEKKIKNVKFWGYIVNDAKKRIFLKSNIFVFPTTHGEGLPIAVLEAISFGIPVVTRPVGGIKNFFINGKHGFMTESTSADEIANILETLISDNMLRKNISLYNYDYGKKNFLASTSAKRIEKFYCDLISK